MSETLSPDEAKSIRSNLAKIMINPFFLGKLTLKKLISDLSVSLKSLGGDTFIQECEKTLLDRNNQVEHKLITSYGATKEDLKDLIEANMVKSDQTYILHKSWENLTEEDIRLLLPEDKIIINKEIFHERLKQVDFKNLPPVAEKKIIDHLIRDSIGLLREEVILYFNLIKINRLSAIVEEKRHLKKTEDIVRYQKMTEVFINSFIPKVITMAQLKELNEGSSIDKDTLKESIIDKIKAGKFNPIPYITMVTVGQGDVLEHAQEIIATIVQRKKLTSEPIWHGFIAFILFHNTSDDFLSQLKISPSIQLLLQGKKGRLSQKGLAIIRFIHALFLNLCMQISEIRSKYQKANEETRKKIFRLYGNEERLNMLFNASIMITQKALNLNKGELEELAEQVKKYAKRTPVINKNDLLG